MCLHFRTIFILACNNDKYKSLDESELRLDPSPTTELAALQCLKITDNVLITLVTLFLIGSSLLLQLMTTAIKSWMGSKFSKIRSGTAQLAVLENLKNSLRLIAGEML